MGFFEIFAGALAASYAVIPSLGLGIILLTLVVRVLLLPLSIKQTRSMREVQAIQPELQRIKAKYKGNRQKQQEEQMKLYKEHGVNPLGSCLPVFMQFPALIALFYVVRTPLAYLGFRAPGGGISTPEAYRPVPDLSGIMEVLQASRLADDLRSIPLAVNQFLGIRLDCSPSTALQGSDPLRIGEACGSGVLSALPYLVLALLMGLTTWYQQKQMQASRDPNDPTARQMEMFAKVMPAFLVVLAFTFPAGVVLYWITTNVWTIAQQRIMLRAAPPVPELAPATAGDGKGKKEVAQIGSDKGGKKGAEPERSEADGHKRPAEASQPSGKTKAGSPSGKGASKPRGKSSGRSGGRSGKKKRKR